MNQVVVKKIVISLFSVKRILGHKGTNKLS